MTESLGKSQKLGDFIHLHKGLFSLEFCDEVLQEYASADFKYGGHPSFDLNVRNLKELNISDENLINSANSYVRSKIDYTVYKTLKDSPALASLYPHANFQVDEGYSLRRMEKDHFYTQHTDQGIGIDWKVSCSICLTDDYTGGEIKFFDDPETSYKLGRGDMLTFPSNFMFPHEVTPITSGIRYVIVTWLS